MGSEQPLKKLSALLLHTYIPAASVPAITMFAVICALELPFKQPVIKIFTAGDQVSSGPQVKPLCSCCLLVCGQQDSRQNSKRFALHLSRAVLSW